MSTQIEDAMIDVLDDLLDVLDDLRWIVNIMSENPDIVNAISTIVNDAVRTDGETLHKLDDDSLPIIAKLLAFGWHLVMGRVMGKLLNKTTATSTTKPN